jgi:RimJ/RimL family protein N-acetyltransferase
MDTSDPADIPPMSSTTDPPAAAAPHVAAALQRPGLVVVRLDDGAAVRLREARSDDDAALRAMYLGLSDLTRYLYFRAGVPATPTWAERFAALGRADGRASYALVAEAGDAPATGAGVVGLARFDRSADGRAAEVGLLLADAWQSRGLGRFVLERLGVEARRRTVAVFTGSVLWENRRMLRLARRLFPQLQADCAQGVCDLTMALG